MLVKRQQGAQGFRRQFVEQDQRRRLVAGADLLRRDSGGPVVVHAQAAAFGFGGFERLADHEGLALRDHVRQQLFLHVVGGLGILLYGDEFQRHHVLGLVQHLEEGVLGVCAFVAKDDRAGFGVQQRALRRGALAVRFHFELLQEGGQPAQTVNVRNHRAAGAIEADTVVDLRGRQQDRCVFGQGRRQEVLVHAMCAIEQALVDVEAEGHDQRQRHRRPQRITPADPVLETEDAVRRDAVGAGLVGRGRNGGHVRTCRGFAEIADQPVARGQEIGQGFLCRERFRHGDDQGFRRIEPGQRQGQFGAVDIGDEAHVDLRLQGRQGLEDQARPEIGTADADMDDSPERLAGSAGDQARTDGAGIVAHGVARRLDVMGDLRPAQAHVLAVGIAQGHVKNGPVLGDVDRLAGPHLVARLGQARLFEGGDGGFEACLRPALLGDIDIKPAGLQAHARQAIRIGRELVDDPDPGIRLGLGLEGIQSVAHGHLR